MGRRAPHHPALSRYRKGTGLSVLTQKYTVIGGRGGNDFNSGVPKPIRGRPGSWLSFDVKKAEKSEISLRYLSSQQEPTTISADDIGIDVPR